MYLLVVCVEDGFSQIQSHLRTLNEVNVGEQVSKVVVVHSGAVIDHADRICIFSSVHYLECNTNTPTCAEV